MSYFCETIPDLEIQSLYIMKKLLSLSIVAALSFITSGVYGGESVPLPLPKAKNEHRQFVQPVKASETLYSHWSKPLKAVSYAQTSLLSEDFSLMKAGSEAAPDENKIVGTVPEELTHTPGWEGATVRQAGGCVMLDDYTLTYQGQSMTVHYLDTPLLGLTKTSTISVTFRARTSDSAGDTFYILCAQHNGSSSSTLATQEFPLSEKWQEYNVLLTGCPVNTYLEFQSETAPCFVDDIDVTVIPDLETPKVLAATDITDRGFTANWTAVPDATGYIVNTNIIRTSTGEDPYFLIDTEFEGIQDGSAEEPILEYIYSYMDEYIDYKGWIAYFPMWAGEALGISNQYLDRYGNGYLQSPTLDLSANEGVVNVQMKYMAKNVDMFQVSLYTQLESGKMSLRSTRMVYPQKNGQWEELNTTINGGTSRSVVVIVLPETTYGSIIMDNLKMWQELPEGTRYTVPMQRTLSDTNSAVISTVGCKADDRFSYNVQAYRQLNGTTFYSAESNTIVVGDASDEVPSNIGKASVKSTSVDGGRFTAVWDAVPGANAYEVAVYREHYSDGKESTTVLFEDFNAIKVGTTDLDRPKAMNESGYDRLDQYTNIPGWEVFQGFYVDGAVGILGYWNMMGVGCYMKSPIIDLSGDDGNMMLTLKVGSDSYRQGATVYLAHDDPKTGATVYDDMLPLDEMDFGMHSFMQTMKGGREDSYLVFFPYGYGLSYFDDIKLTQKLPEGTTSTRVTGLVTGQTSLTMTVPAVDTNDKYYYTVRPLWVDAYDKEKVSGTVSEKEYIQGLVPTTTCSGTVKEVDGEGVANVEVRLFAADAPDKVLTATTNRWGNFRVENISDYKATYVIQAVADGYFTATMQGLTFTDGEPVSDIELFLRPAQGDNIAEVGSPTSSEVAGPVYLQYNNSDSETLYPQSAISIPAGSKILSIAYDGYCPAQKSVSYKMNIYVENVKAGTAADFENGKITPRDVAEMTSYAAKTVKIDKAGSKDVPAQLMEFENEDGFVYDGGDLRVSLASRATKFNDVYFLVDATRKGKSAYRYYASTAADNWKVNEAGMPVMRVAYKAPNGLFAEAVLGSDLRISTAEGSITLGADTDTTVTVYNVSGMAVALVNLSAGHDETIMLPAGIYLVGNQKVIVK